MNQTREKLEDTEYKVVTVDEEIIPNWPIRRDAVLVNKETGGQESWQESDEFAGYVIEIDGVGFEFVRRV